jgi:valyl-tRNA synthetase
MSKTRLYDGNTSAAWALHRIVRDLLSIFSPICPFFTHYLSTTIYGNSAVDVKEFPELPQSCNREIFHDLRSLTEDLEKFNSIVWKAKKDSGVSLRSPISGIVVPEKLSIFSKTLEQMHNLE